MMTSRARSIIAALAVLCAGLLIWSQAGAALSHFARRLMAGHSGEASPARPAIRFEESVIAIEGASRESLDRLKEKKLSAVEWSLVFAVYPGERIPQDAPPMLGDYSVEDAAIIFTPRFPLVAGLTYTAKFDPASYIPAKKEAARVARVAAVYPSSDEIPENQLKLYIEFSAPMSEGEAYNHIRLLDERGREAKKVFLRLEQELWDENHRRLTLWFDPGRIKRGLRPNLEMGAPLVEGHRYRLIIDSALKDENGNPLIEGFEKTYTVTRADRSAIDVEGWKLIAPRVATRQPVRLILPEPLDRALLESSLVLLDDHGNRVEGAVEIIADETEWRFAPAGEWKAGSYMIEIDSRLEDRAGNSLQNLFDNDLKRSKPVSSDREAKVRLRFETTAAGDE
jgi:hypothetical protein